MSEGASRVPAALADSRRGVRSHAACATGPPLPARALPCLRRALDRRFTRAGRELSVRSRL